MLFPFNNYIRVTKFKTYSVKVLKLCQVSFNYRCLKLDEYTVSYIHNETSVQIITNLDKRKKKMTLVRTYKCKFGKIIDVYSAICAFLVSL